MMEIQVAHLRIQGTDFIFVPFSSSMARLSAAEQSAVLGELRTFCRSAGLVGEVVPVWQGTTGTSYLSDPDITLRCQRRSVLRLSNRN